MCAVLNYYDGKCNADAINKDDSRNCAKPAAPTLNAKDCYAKAQEMVCGTTEYLTKATMEGQEEDVCLAECKSVAEQIKILIGGSHICVTT